MSAAVNLQERRTLLPTDARSVVDAIVEGAESLHAAASSLPLSPIRESSVIGIERHLVSLSVLLSNLRRCVAPTARNQARGRDEQLSHE